MAVTEFSRQFCSSVIDLRDYQTRLIDKIKYEFDENGNDAVMAVASTGAGKTICFSYIAEQLAQNACRVFIVVHRKELIRQTCRSLRRNGIPHGVIAAGHKITDTPIQVCSIQSLVARLHLFDAPELIVFDEAHHCKAKNYLKLIQWGKDSGSKILGVTATPHRADGERFDDVFDVMVEADTIQQLIDGGWLIEPTVFAPPLNQVDTSLLRVGRAGDFLEAEMEAMMDKPVITGSAVEHYKRYLPHCPPSVAFCVSVKHAQHVAAEFCAAGIPAASIDGSMDDDQREQLVKDLENGVIKVLTSCDLISEGFDLPAIVCIIMLRPVSAKCVSMFMQQMGRVIRICEGKTEAYVFDHVENYKRHGFVTDIRDWRESFEGRAVKKKESKDNNLTTCPKCYSVFPRANFCPACGENLKPKPVEGVGPGREIEQVDGELVKLNKADILTFRSTTASGGRKKQEIRKLKRIN